MKKILTTTLLCSTLLCNANSLAHVMNSDDCIKMNSEYTFKMLDRTQNIAKKQRFLFREKHNYLAEQTLYTGVSFIGLADYQQSNRDSKFGYLMRIPTASNQIGKTVHEVSVHSFQAQFSGSLNSWSTIYSELLYSPEQSFGHGTITALSRNQVQVKRAYVLLGDKNITPLYFSIGKQDLPFGLLDTVSPFTASTTWHAFGPLAYSAIIGIDHDMNNNNINMSVGGIQGGAQFRVANTKVRHTNVPSRLNNYVADINYSYNMNCNNSISLGASYLHGTAYNSDFPILHFDPGVINNPAYDVYAQLNLKNFTLQGEYAQTLKRWPGTHNPSPPLNEHPASRVNSFAVGAAYNFANLYNHKNLKLSLEFSQFVSGAKKSPWHRQNQTVLGLSSMYKYNVKLFAEFIHTMGYAPLNLLSGDHKGVKGTTHSDKAARSNVFLIGIQGTL